ncbi:hypothetical protein Q8F55_008412 [Vanrija albida]|uniref:Amino acid transporter transmembrane domain-containing protein n=1 Tax=Vanrija albida TaxID=181172 RepID=A0ABR3PW82_9TREE
MISNDKVDHSEQSSVVLNNDIEKTGASKAENYHQTQTTVHDAVFGDIAEGEGPNYRAVGPKGAFVLLTKVNLGLGVLGLPKVMNVLGLIPGLIVIFAIMIIFTYCATMIGKFKLAHPEVYSIADAAYVFGGRPAKEFWFFGLTLQMIFFVAAGCVGISTALNAVSAHATCTAVFIAVGGVLAFLLGSIRTLGKITWIGWVGLASLLIAIFIVTIAVGVQDRPSAAPQHGPFDKEFRLFGKSTFAQATSGVNQILFAYGSTPMFFGVASEMREPRQFTRAMQGSMYFLTVIYVVVGTVVYVYCGKFVASPSLGSAGPLLKKVCYGIAIPGLLATLTLFTHMAAKNIFVRVLAGSKHLTSNSMVHWVTWLGITAGCAIIGYIIASAIPIFDTLLSFIGALVVPSLCVIPYTFMWWHDNFRYVPKEDRTLKLKFYAAINVVCFFIGIYLTAAGAYGAIDELINTSVDAKPWSCADNSGTVKSD